MIGTKWSKAYYSIKFNLKKIKFLVCIIFTIKQNIKACIHITVFHHLLIFLNESHFKTSIPTACVINVQSCIFCFNRQHFSQLSVVNFILLCSLNLKKKKMKSASNTTFIYHLRRTDILVVPAFICFKL